MNTISPADEKRGITGSRPRVSIVTINLNMADGLKETIASVARQDFADKEYIVIDGGSSDRSRDVIGENDSVIDAWVSEPDRGIYDAMNKAVAICHGDWVLFMNSGDVFARDDILRQIFSTPAEGATGVMFGDAIVCHVDGSRRLWTAFPPHELPYGMICSHQAIVARRELLQNMPFTIGKSASDYEFLIFCWRGGIRFQQLNMVVCEVRAGGISDRKRVGSVCERWQLLRKNRLVTPWVAVHYAVALAQAAVAPMVKPLLPRRALAVIRKIKGRAFTR